MVRITLVFKPLMKMRCVRALNFLMMYKAYVRGAISFLTC